MNNIILSPIGKDELVNEIADAVILKLSPVTEKPVEPEELIQTKAVMKLLGKSRTTVNHWRDLGILKYQVLNSRIYFKRSDVLNAGLHINQKRNY